MKTSATGTLILLLSFGLAWSEVLPAKDCPPPTKADEAGVRQASLDYIEGWYAGDVARMSRALHPELAKRRVFTDPKSGRSVLEQMGAMTLVQKTQKAYGAEVPKPQQKKDVAILDICRDAASVRIDAATWIDYLQLAKWNGEWKIVNVLWESAPESH